MEPTCNLHGFIMFLLSFRFFHSILIRQTWCCQELIEETIVAGCGARGVYRALEVTSGAVNKAKHATHFRRQTSSDIFRHLQTSSDQFKNSFFSNMPLAIHDQLRYIIFCQLEFLSLA